MQGRVYSNLIQTKISFSSLIISKNFKLKIFIKSVEMVNYWHNTTVLNPI